MLKRTAGITAMTLLLVASCGGDGDGGSALCGKFFGKLQECGVFSAGKICVGQFTTTDRDVCLIDCVVAASCTEVDAAYCQMDNTLFDRCLMECPEVRFDCGDGSDIPEAWICDAEADCTDGSDEVGCPAGTIFTCGNSNTIPGRWKCDGDNDCGDNSDEEGCPVFNCTNGETISAADECDGTMQCTDGSDEAGCAELSCM